MHPHVLLHHLKFLTHYQAWPHKLSRARKILLFFLIFLALAVSFAALYPHSRLGVRTNIGGSYVGGKSYAQAVSDLKEQSLETQPITISFNEVTIQTNYSEAGVTFDEAASVNRAINRQATTQPGFLNWKLLFLKQQQELVIQHNQQKFSEFIQRNLKQYLSGPHNATVAIENGEAAIMPSVVGLKFREDWFMQELQANAKVFNTELKFKVEQVEPKVKSADASAAFVKVQNLLSRKPILQHKDKVYIVEPQTLESWIKISNSTEVTLDNSKIKNYVKNTTKNLNIPVKHTHRMLRDGKVIHVTEGTVGQKVDVNKTTKEIVNSLNNQADLVKISLKSIEPKVIDTRGYSPTDYGLSLLLKDFASSYGTSFGIRVYSLDGAAQAGYNANKQFVTASTYKMFLAYAVLHEVEAGKLSLDSSTNIGWSVEACINEMISHSTNFCAIALGQKIGWARADQILHNSGFTDTTINNYNSLGYIVGDKYSTASDEANFIKDLHNRTLLNNKHSNYLLGLMKNQIYRDGIPSGVPYGTVVANKIGFLSGYLHDSAIVYSPERTYLLSIMTYGGGWWQFAELSRRVHTVFNP